MANQVALTERQRQVLTEIAAGRSNKQIADKLFIPEPTVKTYVAEVRRILGGRSRAEIAIKYLTRYVTPENRALLRDTPPVQRFLAGLPHLTSEERRVLDAMAAHPEMENEELAAELGLGIATVKKYKGSMANKCVITAPAKSLMLVICYLIARGSAGVE